MCFFQEKYFKSQTVSTLIASYYLSTDRIISLLDFKTVSKSITETKSIF